MDVWYRLATSNKQPACWIVQHLSFGWAFKNSGIVELLDEKRWILTKTYHSESEFCYLNEKDKEKKTLKFTISDELKFILWQQLGNAVKPENEL